MAINAITAFLIATATVQVVLAGSVGYSPNYCIPPSVLHYGGYRPNNAYFPVGSKIQYYCDDGYDLDGYGTSACVYDSKSKLAHFSYDPPVCRRIRCPHVKNPEYGRVVITGDYYHGALATYSCDHHYEIVGVSTIKCQGGIWIGKAPICRPVRCPLVLNPKYGKVIITGDYYYDSTATFECNKYYVLDGPPTKKCLNGKWVGKTPICKPISCPELEDPDYGTVVVVGDYYSGSSATYKCNNYYVLTGPHTRRCVYGKWEGKAPICEPIRCPKLSHLEYGKVNIVGDYLHDSVATYSCIKDYEVYGTPTKKCVYGRWEGKTPQCLPINYCPKLDNPEYGQVYVNRGNQYGAAQIWQTMIRTIVQDQYLQKIIRKEIGDYDISSYDDFYKMLETKELVTQNGLSLIQLVIKRVDSFSTATYSCDKYYKLKGSSTRRCYYGLWDGDEPTCEPVKCSELDHPKYGRVSISGDYYRDSTATYTCDKHYVLIGKPTRKCYNGHWSGKVPICEPVRCPPLPSPKYGNVYITGDYYHDATATYKCNKHYVISGPVTRKCAYGKWGGKAPTCESITCPTLPHPIGGKVVIKGDYYQDSTATYSCNKGSVIYGLAIRKCVYGEWQGKAPTCGPITCAQLPHPKYGKVIITGDYYHDSTATYYCNKGYAIYGESSRKCAHGVWGGKSPICKPAPIVPKKCPPLPYLAYGKVDVTGDYYYDSVATYTCDKGFKPYGAVTRRCRHGVWEGKAPICKHYGPPIIPKRCRLLAAPDYGAVHASSNTIGAITRYQCVAGYKLVGNPTRMCLSNGEWGGEAPVCKPVDCGPLVKPDYGYVKYDNTYYGSRAYYSCQSGYKLTTSSNFRICQANRSWSGPVPLCSHAY